jgi:hypothetical protein
MYKGIRKRKRENLQNMKLARQNLSMSKSVSHVTLYCKRHDANMSNTLQGKGGKGGHK